MEAPTELALSIPDTPGFRRYYEAYVAVVERFAAANPEAPPRYVSIILESLPGWVEAYSRQELEANVRALEATGKPLPIFATVAFPSSTSAAPTRPSG